MTSQCTVSLGRVWTHIYNLYSIRILKKNGGTRAFWRAIAVWKMVCFWPFFAILTNLRAYVCLCLTRTHDVISSPKWLKICKCTKKSIRIQIHAKKRNIYCPYVLLTRMTRTRTHTRITFWNAQNDLKRTLNWQTCHFDNFKSLTRAYHNAQRVF